MVPLSVLDLAPVPKGSDVRTALASSLNLAQHAERLGYSRYWLAEHHGMPGIASAATAVVIGHIASGTTTIRVGAGGIMLPNHAPLIIAEQFGTLAALHGPRIDLGLGRAPGTDPLTSRALRRDLASSAEAFPEDVLELASYFEDDPARPVRAIPGAGEQVQMWILGSSTFGAQVAAALGLPFAFASHFAPAQMRAALEFYRQRFRAQKGVSKPHVMLGVNAFVAPTREEAELLSTSVQQAFVALRTGRPGKLEPPLAGYLDTVPHAARAMLDSLLECTFIGTADKVAADLARFAERMNADELIVTSQIYDHEARVRSYRLLAEAAHLRADAAR